MKLVGVRAADVAGVRFHGAELQLHPRQDPRVAVVHLLVGRVEACLIEMERVAILHGELPRSHHPESGTDLVTKLGLYLIEVARHLPVAVDLPPEQVSNDLLVGWRQAEVPLVTILHAQHLGTHLLPAAGLLPQFCRLHHRHQHFLGAAAIHLLANDGLDPADHAQPQGQPGVKARCHLADDAGPQHQAMAGHVGVRRILFHGGNEQRGLPHVQCPLGRLQDVRPRLAKLPQKRGPQAPFLTVTARATRVRPLSRDSADHVLQLFQRRHPNADARWLGLDHDLLAGGRIAAHSRLGGGALDRSDLQ